MKGSGKMSGRVSRMRKLKSGERSAVNLKKGCKESTRDTKSESRSWKEKRADGRNDGKKSPLPTQC